MSAKWLCLAILVSATMAAPQDHNLPVLFQFSQPSHSVSVFRGAALKKAIAAGLVKGFGSLGAGREGKSDDSDSDDKSAGSSYGEPATTVSPVTTPVPTVAPVTTPAPTAAPVTTPAPTAAPVTYRIVTPALYKPAPYVYRPAPVVYKPAPVVYRPAPAPVVYRPAPAPIVYKPAPAPVPAYVEPAYAQDGLYTFEYAVKDDYTSNDFGAKEGRDGANANGKYVVALPDGRIQTVTWTVDGANGYVPIVEYSGEAQYPAEPTVTYTN